MTKKKLTLIHTSETLVPVFERLCRASLPGVEITNVVEAKLIQDVITHCHLRPSTIERVSQLVVAAEDSGADCILVTCSSIGSAVETAAGRSGVPVLRVDRPMALRAVEIGPRVGVIATLSTTLEPTADLVERCASEAGKSIELVSRLCEGAFEALMNGDAAKHDAMVSAELQALMSEVDVIVLAQASMARVVDALPESAKRVPILASPAIAIDFLATIL